MPSRVAGILLAIATLVVLSATHPTRSSAAPAAPGIVYSITGNTVGDGGPAIDAWLNEPEAVDVDAAGNIYIGNTRACAVQAIDANAVIRTVAGNGVCGFNGDAMPATSTQLTLPRGIYVDRDRNLYIADSGAPASNDPGNCRIRKVGADAIMRIIAGTGVCDFSGDGGPPTDAALKNPKSIAVDSQGDVVIADYDNCRVRKIQGNVISTIAGSNCEILDPFGLTIGPQDDIYIADSGNSRIQLLRKGSLIPLAGPPDIASATDVALDAAGNLFIADTGHCLIKKVAAPVYAEGRPGPISTVAGTGTCGYTGDGDALATALNYPGGIAVDAAGDVLIADTLNCRIRKVSASRLTTVSGNGRCHTVSPSGVAVDSSGNVFVADTNILDCHVLRVTPAGNVSLIAGLATSAPQVPQLPCGFTGDGVADAVKLNVPNALAVDAAGNLYIADAANCRIRRVSAGAIATAAGKGSCRFGGDGGPAADAFISRAQGIAIDAAGSLYIADTGNCLVRKVDASGTIRTIAGNTACDYAGDGGPATAAALNEPAGVAVDGAGAVYIADTQNCRIRKVNAAGTISTVAGNGDCAGGGDGDAALAASLNHPSDVALDPAGRLYIADTDNCRIRAVSPDTRTIATAAGLATCGYSGDGGLATAAAFNRPKRVAIDAKGNLYVADTANGRVRVVNAGGATTVVQPAPAGSASPAAGAPTPPPAAAAPDAGGSGTSWVVFALIFAGAVAGAVAVAVVLVVRLRARA